MDQKPTPTSSYYPIAKFPLHQKAIMSITQHISKETKLYHRIDTGRFSFKEIQAWKLYLDSPEQLVVKIYEIILHRPLKKFKDYLQRTMQTGQRVSVELFDCAMSLVKMILETTKDTNSIPNLSENAKKHFVFIYQSTCSIINQLYNHPLKPNYSEKLDNNILRCLLSLSLQYDALNIDVMTLTSLVFQNQNIQVQFYDFAEIVFAQCLDFEVTTCVIRGLELRLNSYSARKKQVSSIYQHDLQNSIERCLHTFLRFIIGDVVPQSDALSRMLMIYSHRRILCSMSTFFCNEILISDTVKLMLKNFITYVSKCELENRKKYGLLLDWFNYMIMNCKGFLKSEEYHELMNDDNFVGHFYLTELQYLDPITIIERYAASAEGARFFLLFTYVSINDPNNSRGLEIHHYLKVMDYYREIKQFEDDSSVKQLVDAIWNQCE